MANPELDRHILEVARAKALADLDRRETERAERVASFDFPMKAQPHLAELKVDRPGVLLAGSDSPGGVDQNRPSSSRAAKT